MRPDRVFAWLRPRYLGLSCLMLTACATQVRPLGDDTYLVSVQGHGLETFESLTADATDKANAYCTKMGKTARGADVKKVENVQREVDLTFACR